MDIYDYGIMKFSEKHPSMIAIPGEVANTGGDYYVCGDNNNYYPLSSFLQGKKYLLSSYPNVIGYIETDTILPKGEIITLRKTPVSDSGAKMYSYGDGTFAIHNIYLNEPNKDLLNDEGTAYDADKIEDAFTEAFGQFIDALM